MWLFAYYSVLIVIKLNVLIIVDLSSFKNWNCMLSLKLLKCQSLSGNDITFQNQKCGYLRTTHCHWILDLCSFKNWIFVLCYVLLKCQTLSGNDITFQFQLIWIVIIFIYFNNSILGKRQSTSVGSTTPKGLRHPSGAESHRAQNVI